MSTEGRNILLVEDNEDDVFIMQRALKRTGMDLKMQVVMDGQQAMDYLGGKGKYADRGIYPLPLVIFLDLKLPYVRGIDVLELIRREETLQRIAVVILTSSPEQRDREMAEALGAKAFRGKPPT